jgi:DNA invertase Pin-like site-specific DNA recombinase
VSSTIRAAIDARVSTREQTLEMQIHEHESYAESQGWEHVVF